MAGPFRSATPRSADDAYKQACNVQNCRSHRMDGRSFGGAPPPPAGQTAQDLQTDAAEGAAVKSIHSQRGQDADLSQCQTSALESPIVDRFDSDRLEPTRLDSVRLAVPTSAETSPRAPISGTPALRVTGVLAHVIICRHVAQ